MSDSPITCWICKQDAPWGNKDPRSAGGYPADSIEARAWVVMNCAPKDLCEACYTEVTTA